MHEEQPPLLRSGGIAARHHPRSITNYDADSGLAFRGHLR
jgi:hypothetical protein